ncbi:MAG TPA: polysaccharide deacetylase family protein [Gaiellaceae bacterium]|nr:polysaccharide deacetylase family protein [Gaiellaceae bacterium]
MASSLASILAAGPGRARRVALTFDDGPAASTEDVLDVLAAESVRATFFVIGRNVAGREPTLRRARAEGHELGIHGFEHLNALLVRDAATLSGELTGCADELERAVGERPRLVRPPYGGDAGRTAREAGRLGLGPVVLWTVLGFDWEDGEPAGSIAARVLEEAQPGAIVCLHDGDRKDPAVTRDATVAALPAIVQGLRRDGYELVTVSELLG